MGSIKKMLKFVLKKLGLYFIVNTKIIISDFIRQYYLPKNNDFFGYKDESARVRTPIIVNNPKKVFIGKGSRIGTNATIFNTTGKFIVKDRCAISKGLTVVTGNHGPVVGVSITDSNISRLSDSEKDIIINSESWIGINVTLISGASIGRGVIVGACSLVNKEIPPYAVVAGVPAKIIGVKFSKEQILRHEELLYQPCDRLTLSEIDYLFEKYYKNKKILCIETF